MPIDLPGLVSLVFLCAGMAAILVAARGMRRLSPLIAEGARVDWRVLRSLAAFFVYGGFGLAVAVLRREASLLALLMSVVFAFGGLFLNRVVRVGHVTARALEDRRRRLDEILTAMVDAVVVLDVDGTIRSVNEALCGLLGVDRDAIVARPLADILAPDDGATAADTAAALVERLVGGATEQRELAFRDVDGRSIPTSLAGSPLRDADGTVTGVVLVARDLRERLQLLQDAARVYVARDKAAELERANEQLEEQSVELERSNTELQQFAYIASHDLQEPLRMITSYLQLLESRHADALDAQAHEFIGFAVDGAARMRALIEALLDYSRVERRMRAPTRIDLNRTLAQVTGNLREAIRESGATVLHEELPEVLADEGQLVQLLQNLVGNAIKFRSDAPPSIHLSAARDGAMWQIALQDNGIGIEPRFAERIFAIFQRLHTREAYPGIGIGLAICKKIVELHGGRIWVESPPHGGTTFRFTLPAADVGVDHDHDGEPVDPAAAASVTDPSLG